MSRFDERSACLPAGTPDQQSVPAKSRVHPQSPEEAGSPDRLGALVGRSQDSLLVLTSKQRFILNM